ncbi:MAG: malonyl-ACP O-methyltransferase BioC [Propionivibrio sp.]|uniref:Malonyl-[acyl-carrier protein] O-methyltransferase n=1 Tax=Candidatus Propionivibrio dominans TaxID=2954373 RepID=A0A9D7FD54_9RHOO|nr:malonyl-ACP O-methyltransferase BioC [Candidatus Propionivibrio dominans]
MSAPAPFVDSRQVRRNFARAAASGYDAVAVLQREVGSRMLERLDYVKIDPGRVLDLGCGTGASLGALSERYAKSQVLGTDLSEAMLQAGRKENSRLRWLLPFLRASRRSSALVAADTLALPFTSGSVGLIWSNLMLHWLDDPVPAFREMHRVLNVGGLLMFSTFGPDTLKELRASFSDGYVHTQRFADMHDYGDMLLECGYADPVMDVDVLTMTYSSIDDLFRDLRQSGAACAMQARRHGLMGRSAWHAARTEYEKYLFEGRLPATFEIVYGHAWKAQARKTADGSTIVRFDPKQRLR